MFKSTFNKGEVNIQHTIRNDSLQNMDLCRSHGTERCLEICVMELSGTAIFGIAIGVTN